MICNFYYLTVTTARLSWIINVSKRPPFSLGKNAPNYTFNALGIFHWIAFDFDLNSLVKPDTCPHSGARIESCECFHNRRASGITHFSKIRLNVTSLRVLSKFNADFYIIFSLNFQLEASVTSASFTLTAIGSFISKRIQSTFTSIDSSFKFLSKVF